MTHKIRLVIADDQPRARQSIRALLETSEQIEQVGEAANGREAIDLVGQLQPDLVLMDARMPELDGIEATRELKTRWPQLHVIVHSLYPDYLFEALAAGADKFISKGESPEALLSAILQVSHLEEELEPVRESCAEDEPQAVTGNTTPAPENSANSSELTPEPVSAEAPVATGESSQ